jgi:aminopeptidase N
LLLVLTAVLEIAVRGQAPLVPAPNRIDVIHYDVSLEPDLAARSVTGRVTIRFASRTEGRSIEFDSGELVVDAVREGSTSLEFERRERHLQIRLAHPAKANESRDVTIAYHGSPRSGLQFPSNRQQVYTVFSTSQWMVCVDAPEDKATLRLAVVLPAELKAAGSGRLISKRPAGTGKLRYEWQEDRPVSTYTFGFAAGAFTEVNETDGDVQLRYLGEGFSETDLRRIFRDTVDMRRFFQERAGVTYPSATYAQVLTTDGIGQEMSGLSIMPEAFGRGVLDDEQAISLAAHELAHQWWGNQVTCREWTHFWLNEGFATFMAAAYRGHRFGPEIYSRDIAAARARYEKVRGAGKDGPLVFKAWSRPTADDRTLVYQKGAVVLHELRELVGEQAFWEGIRQYTRANFGKSVVTTDFQSAMEQSTGRNLAEFFTKWAYGG